MYKIGEHIISKNGKLRIERSNVEKMIMIAEKEILAWQQFVANLKNEKEFDK